MIGKFVLFSAGMLVGAGAILASNKVFDTEPELPQHEIEAPTPVVQSPLAVVVEDDSPPPAVDLSVPDALLQPLIERLEQAEERIADLELALADVEASQPQVSQPPIAPEQSTEDDLLNSGFDPYIVDEIQSIRNQVQLQRLDLRDRATREGWVNSDRFRELFRELNRDSKLREALGDEDYEKLLLAEGRNNRVRIDSVIANSAAEVAGIESGDVLFRYADERIFTFGDLRAATTSGQRDEPVSVSIVRDGETMDFVVPRGPLGVTISGAIGE